MEAAATSGGYQVRLRTGGDGSVGRTIAQASRRRARRRGDDAAPLGLATAFFEGPRSASDSPEAIDVDGCNGAALPPRLIHAASPPQSCRWRTPCRCIGPRCLVLSAMKTRRMIQYRQGGRLPTRFSAGAAARLYFTPCRCTRARRRASRSIISLGLYDLPRRAPHLGAQYHRACAPSALRDGVRNSSSCARLEHGAMRASYVTEDQRAVESNYPPFAVDTPRIPGACRAFSESLHEQVHPGCCKGRAAPTEFGHRTWPSTSIRNWTPLCRAPTFEDAFSGP